jgi:ferric iron reductase protein FhuF
LCFCKPIVKIFYKRTKHPSRDQTHRYLNAIMVSCVCFLCFCKHILQQFYKRTTHPSREPTHRTIITSHAATIFCNHLAKLLQKIEASQKNRHIQEHIASHATIFCNHLAKLLQKIIASQKNRHIQEHIASHATIFCNHLAKLLQKIVASQKINSSHAATRSLNPRFLMHHFGQKTGFRARMNEIESGIPCSGCDYLL